jgi:hypothetical protein
LDGVEKFNFHPHPRPPPSEGEGISSYISIYLPSPLEGEGRVRGREAGRLFFAGPVKKVIHHLGQFLIHAGDYP